MDAQTLEQVNEILGGTGFFGTFLMVPVVDGDFIVERPIATIERGTLNAVGDHFMIFQNASAHFAPNPGGSIGYDEHL